MNKTINKLTKNGLSIVEVKEKKLKESYVGHDRINSHTFPDEPIVIYKIKRCGDKTSYVYYINFKKNLSTYTVVPNDMIVSLTPLKEKNKVKKLYDAFIVEHLKDRLHHVVKLGSDPEIFIEDKDGNIIPSFKFLGSKKETKDLSIGNYGGFPIYWDGFQAEFETSAQTCLAWHVDSVQAGLKGTLLAAHKYKKDAKLSIQTVMEIPPEMLQNEADKYVEFGCMPSLNVYNMKGLSVSGRELPYRSAGGHIHLGFEGIKKSKVVVQRIVKALDMILGVACVSLFAKYDNPKRRECYGLAGEYRLPKHGLEYRVLSNAWLAHPLIMNLVFDLARKAMMMGENDYLKYWKATQKETIECINNCDFNKAKYILNNNKNIMIQLFQASYKCSDKEASKLFDIFINGMESVVEDPSDLVTNWNLQHTWTYHSDGKNKNYKHSINDIVEGKKVA